MITKGEIANLIAFAKELDRRLQQSRIKQNELSRLTRKGSLAPISAGYISDILRAGRGASIKYFRLNQDKVIRLAEAIGWPVDEALFVAGFQASNIQSQPSKNKTLRFDQERLARLTENIASLPEEEQEELDIPFSMLEYDIERRVRRVRERKS